MQQSEKKEPKDIFEFLQVSFQRGALSTSKECGENLYKNIWSTKAVFQCLSSVAQQFVVRMVVAGVGNERIFTSDQLNSWLKVPQSSIAKELKQYKLIDQRKSKQTRMIVLDTHFCEQLRALLSQGESLLPFEKKTEKPSETLERVSKATWHTILQYLLDDYMGITDDETNVTQSDFKEIDLGVKNLFYEAGLLTFNCTECNGSIPPAEVVQSTGVLIGLKRCPYCNSRFRDEKKRVDSYGSTDMPRKMTGKAYNFVLKPTPSQSWTVILAILEQVGDDCSKTIALLEFFFSLGYCHSGDQYSSTKLNAHQMVCMQKLHSLGFLFWYERDQGFYPCNLIIDMVFGASKRKDLNAKQSGRLQVIVETNFKVYAYTTSILDKLLLNQFLLTEDSMPNMAIGKIRREEVVRAFGKGITPDQIISYLEEHLHSHTLSKIPINVHDQLVMWWQDEHPLEAKQVTKIDQFDNEEQFQTWKSFAEEEGLLVDCDDRGDEKDRQTGKSKSKLIVFAHAESAMRQFSKELKEKQTAGHSSANPMDVG